MAGAIPSNVLLVCPREKTLRQFVDISGGGTLYRCAGCEWPFTMGTTTPTGTSNAAITTPATTLAISVASGGASFTSGMYLLYDTGVSAEVVQVVGSASGTSIPVPAGFAKAHLTAATFGQLTITPALSGVGQNAVPAAPGWGF